MIIRWIIVPVLLVLAVLLLFRNSVDEASIVSPSQGLPWQIALDVDGVSTVFGITLGKSRLSDALVALGSDMELAIIAAPRMSGNLEMYFGHYRMGIVTGKLVLQAAVPENQLLQWRGRAIKQSIMPTGEARKFILDPEDMPAALASVIASITFIPAIRLDEEIVISRFGEPDKRLQTAAGVTHYLYTEKGLAITVSEEAKDVMQYVAPAVFSRLEQPFATLD